MGSRDRCVWCSGTPLAASSCSDAVLDWPWPSFPSSGRSRGESLRCLSSHLLTSKVKRALRCRCVMCFFICCDTPRLFCRSTHSLLRFNERRRGMKRTVPHSVLACCPISFFAVFRSVWKRLVIPRLLPIVQWKKLPGINRASQCNVTPPPA